MGTDGDLEADRLLHNAGRLVEDGPSPAAGEAVETAVAVCRQAADRNPGTPESGLRLVKALRYQYSLLSFEGELATAEPVLEECAGVARAVLDGTDPRTVGYDETVALVSSVVNDLAKLVGARGRDQRQTELLATAARISERSEGPETRRIRAAVGHNMTEQMLNGFMAGARRHPPDTDALARAAANATMVVGLRRPLVDEQDPTTLWDLAESLHLQGRTFALAAALPVEDRPEGFGDPSAAVSAYFEASTLLGQLTGPAARKLETDVRAEMDHTARMFPHEPITVGAPSGGVFGTGPTTTDPPSTYPPSDGGGTIRDDTGTDDTGTDDTAGGDGPRRFRRRRR